MEPVKMVETECHKLRRGETRLFSNEAETRTRERLKLTTEWGDDTTGSGKNNKPWPQPALPGPQPGFQGPQLGLSGPQPPGDPTRPVGASAKPPKALIMLPGAGASASPLRSQDPSL